MIDEQWPATERAYLKAITPINVKISKVDWDAERRRFIGTTPNTENEEETSDVDDVILDSSELRMRHCWD